MTWTLYLALALPVGEVNEAVYRPAQAAPTIQLAGLRAHRYGCGGGGLVARGGYGGAVYRRSHSCGVCAPTYHHRAYPSPCCRQGCFPHGGYAVPQRGAPNGGAPNGGAPTGAPVPPVASPEGEGAVPSPSDRPPNAPSPPPSGAV